VARRARYLALAIEMGGGAGVRSVWVKATHRRRLKGFPDNFPNEDAGRTLIYLAIQTAVPQRTHTKASTKDCSRSRSSS
jgi:hypothetical protein